MAILSDLGLSGLIWWINLAELIVAILGPFESACSADGVDRLRLDHRQDQADSGQLRNSRAVAVCARACKPVCKIRQFSFKSWCY